MQYIIYIIILYDIYYVRDITLHIISYMGLRERIQF